MLWKITVGNDLFVKCKLTTENDAEAIKSNYGLRTNCNTRFKKKIRKLQKKNENDSKNDKIDKTPKKKHPKFSNACLKLKLILMTICGRTQQPVLY